MAKGLRSKVKKTNKVRLRSKVFQPVENARTERLSAKLMELASTIKPSESGLMKMDVDQAGKPFWLGGGGGGFCTSTPLI